jgi:hypothetical protein
MAMLALVFFAWPDAQLAAQQSALARDSKGPGRPAADAAPITWTSLVNASVAGDLLYKSGGCDRCADAGARSAHGIAAGDGYIEFIVNDPDSLRFIGFTHRDAGTSGDLIDFALRLESGRAEVREAGALQASSVVQRGDALRIQVSESRIRYLRNGKAFHSSRAPATYPLVVSAALYASNASISGARLSGGSLISTPPPPPPPPSNPDEVIVSTTSEFRAAISAARPGRVISLNPGVYEGGSYHSGISGSAEAPIVIQGRDPASAPVIRGGYNGLQFSDAQHIVFQNLIFEGAQQNGINIDDGETIETPSHHIRFVRVVVRNIPSGNRDGIKLSGVTDFSIENSTIERWGDGGSAVDLVGCHRGVISGNLFRHTPGMTGGDGVQAKGGSTGILITGNRFEHAAARAVQIGGTTSLQFFRPQPPDSAEARHITVERNVFVGSETAVAFVSSDGGLVRFNTIYLPTRFLLRILQENTTPGMVTTRNGVVTDNIFYWTGGLVVNIGAGTDPTTFTFARNWWYRADAPASSRPTLPSTETGGVYGTDPGFIAAPSDLRTTGGIPYGAYAGPTAQ